MKLTPLLPWLLLVLAVAPRCDAVVASVVAGGSGKALYFSAQRSDVALFDWDEDGALTDGVTAEVWVKRLDKHTVSVPFSMISWDTDVRSSTRELGLLMIGEYGLWRGTSGGTIHNCPRVNCSFGFDYDRGWHHVAVSQNPRSGSIKLYRDGVLVSDSSLLQPPQLQPRPTRPGLVMLGQFMLSYGNTFDSVVSFDGMLDELRIWRTERTEDEIIGAMHHRLNPDDYPDTLAVMFRFDETGDAETAIDSTAGGRHISLGRLPNPLNEAVFMAPKGTVAATSPRYVASQAPVYGGVVEAYVASEGQVQVELSAWAAGGGSLSTFIEVAPVYGSVHAVFSDDPVPGEAISQGSLVVDPDPGRAQSKRVWYVPGPEFSETGDTFVYTIRDDAGNRASAEVRISFLEAVAPSARTVSIAEDQRISITLGGASVDSHQVATVISDLPERGSLYDISFNNYAGFLGAPDFSKYADVNLSDISRPITRAMLPHSVLDEEGTVLYVPPLNDANFRDTFSYRHVLRKALGAARAPVVTPDAFAHITVVPDNDSPQFIGEGEMTASPDTPTPLQLRATDIDGSFAASTEWWVTEPPRLGSLAHYVTRIGGSAAEELTAMEFEDPADTLIQWASELPPYDPRWGPSFSSQNHGCPSTCCDLQATCNQVDCAASGVNIWPCEASMIRYYAANILGSSDHDTKETVGWLPNLRYAGVGTPFIVIGFPKELYFSSISVLERVSSEFRPAVTRLSVAREYRGNLTEWTVLWEGIPETPSWLTDVEQMAEFKAPSMCQKGALGRYLRIEAGLLTNSTHPFPGVSMEGSRALPRGLLWSANDTVVYEPAPGFHGLAVSCGANCTSHGAPFDTFEVQPSDCIDRGEASRVAVRVTPPATVGIRSTAPDLAQRTFVTVGGEAEVEFGLDGAHVAQLVAENYLLEDDECISKSFTRVAILEDGDGRVVFAQPSDGSAVPLGGEPVPITGDGRTLRVVVDPDRLFHGARLEVWTTVCGITARYTHSVELACPEPPAGEVIDPFVCALNSEVCSDLGVLWDTDRQRCEPPSSSALSMILGLGIGFGTLAALMFLAAAYFGWRSRKLAADLQKMRDVSELDAESPLTMFLSFLADIGDGGGTKGSVRDRRVRERARELRDVLVSSNNLYMPNLDNIADGPNGVMHEDMKRFLLESSAVRTSVDRNSNSSSKASKHCTNSIVELGAGGQRLSDTSGFSEVPEWQDEYDALKDGLNAELGSNVFLDALGLYGKAASGRALEHVAVHVLNTWHVLDVLRISQSRLRGFMRVVVAGYQDNPYHGPAHALDVTCRLATMLTMSGVVDELSGSRDGCITLLALVLAASIHDFKHPGTTNSWVVYKEMEPAMQFNDQAVLENFALHELLLLLREPGSFVSHLKIERRRKLRSQLIELVLATDMSRHFELMAAAQTKVVEALSLGNAGRQSSSVAELNTSGIGSFVQLNAEQQRIVLQIAMKAADLGHCTLPMKLHLPWLQRLEDEFFAQGDLERAENRPISPLMDRFKTGPMVGQNQLGFYSVITLPLYRVWWQMFPRAGEALYDQLHRNYEFFKGNQGPLTLAAVESAHAEEFSSVVPLPGSLDGSPSSISAKGGAVDAQRNGPGKRSFRASNGEKASLIRFQSTAERGKGG